MDHRRLSARVDEALRDFESIPEEYDINAIYGPERPVFVNMRDLEWEVLRELKEMHEEWAGGIELLPTSAYGVRLYRNHSSLVMHHDKIHSHVISSIVHITHKYDDDNVPWPIQIEDHHGRLHGKRSFLPTVL